MANVTGESDIDQLTTLNARLAAAERDCDVAAMGPILDAEFRFRRGDGRIAGRHEFLTDLVKPENRNDILTAEIESIDVRGVQAVVITMVSFSGRRDGDAKSGLFRNIRLFERTETGWSLVMWFNKRVGDLPVDGGELPLSTLTGAMRPAIPGGSVKEHDGTARERGLRIYEEVFGRPRSMEGADALAEMTIDHLFADVWSRTALEQRDRSLITVALLAAQGRDDELRTHLRGAENQGISDAQIQEIMIHVAHYAGWPAGHHGLAVARARAKDCG